jgi:hypothetical protein
MILVSAIKEHLVAIFGVTRFKLQPFHVALALKVVRFNYARWADEL